MSKLNIKNIDNKSIHELITMIKDQTWDMNYFALKEQELVYLKQKINIEKLILGGIKNHEDIRMQLSNKITKTPFPSKPTIITEVSEQVKISKLEKSEDSLKKLLVELLNKREEIVKLLDN